MATKSIYPSIPVPQDNIDSLYQSCLLMRQVIQLLIVNAQTVVDQTLSQASQIFSKKSDNADISNTVTNSLVTFNKSISDVNKSLSLLQNSVTTLQGQVSALQTRTSTAEGNISNLQTRMATVEADITSLQSQINTINTNLTHYLLLTGGTLTGDLNLHESSGVNAIVGKDATGTRWTVHYGDSHDEFSVTDAAGNILFWTQQDGTIHAASAIVVGPHP